MFDNLPVIITESDRTDPKSAFELQRRITLDDNTSWTDARRFVLAMRK